MLTRRLSLAFVSTLVVALPAFFAFPGSASASLVQPGFYEGTTTQKCPPEIATSGICRSGEDLPISFTETRSHITDIRVMVVETCEDSLAPELRVVELHRSIRLRHEWGPRAGKRVTFDSVPHLNGTMHGNNAFGHVHGRTIRGYLAVLTKVADDVYCFNHGVEWTATWHAHPGPPWSALPPSQPVTVTPHPELLQECTAAMRSEAPRVARPLQMFNAGVWPMTIHPGFRHQQATTGVLDLPPMPEACSMKYGRGATGVVQRLHKGKWLSSCLCMMWSGDGGSASLETTAGHPDQPAKWPLYETCNARGRFDKMRVLVSSKLTRPALGTTETGNKTWSYPIAIHGSCAAAARSKRRVQVLQHKWFGTPLHPGW